MRNEFMFRLQEAASAGQKVGLVVGDLGYGVVEAFSEQFPDLFLNSGIAEQSMIGISAGLATTLDRVFVYSIANFPTIRCLEQIRNTVCYHNSNVTVVSIGAGLAYGTLGYTHHAVEDIAVMRVMPNMKIYSPADRIDVSLAMEEILNSSGPSYLRLSKSGEGEIPRLNTSRTDTDFEWLLKSNGPLIVTTGLITSEVLKAASLLESRGITPSVVKLNRLQDFSEEFFDAISKSSRLFIVEEHSIMGGIGSMLLELLARQSIVLPTTLIGIQEPWNSPVGSDQFLRNHFGLSPEGILQQILSFF